MNQAKKIDNSVLIPEMAALLHAGKDVRFTPTGVSMRPFIEGGSDIVVLRKKATVSVGDIALAVVQPAASAVQHPAAQRPDNVYVLHRVIAVDGDSVTLAGDGNLGGTEHCRTQDVLGTVIRIENAKGRRKCLTRGRVWYYIRPCRKWLLKVYRKLLKFGLIGAEHR